MRKQCLSPNKTKQESWLGDSKKQDEEKEWEWGWEREGERSNLALTHIYIFPNLLFPYIVVKIMKVNLQTTW